MRAVGVILMCYLFLMSSAPFVKADEALLSRFEDVVVETKSGKTSFITEIADTDALRARGLMFRHRLPPDRAMLFDFKATRPVMMWMKNTRIALDMVFIRADGIVARVAENTVPMSETIVESGEPVAFVLEVAAGTAKRLGLTPGDRVIHPLLGSSSG